MGTSALEQNHIANHKRQGYDYGIYLQIKRPLKYIHLTMDCLHTLEEQGLYNVHKATADLLQGQQEPVWALGGINSATPPSS